MMENVWSVVQLKNIRKTVLDVLGLERDAVLGVIAEIVMMIILMSIVVALAILIAFLNNRL